MRSRFQSPIAYAMMCTAMSEDPESELLSRLPRRRPHRRSDKRAAAEPRRDEGSSPGSGSSLGSGSSTGSELTAPPRAQSFSSADGAEILGTAVQAAAELAEIGLSVGARALRNAVSRLPRP